MKKKKKRKKGVRKYGGLNKVVGDVFGRYGPK